jgi:hypothetical protein
VEEQKRIDYSSELAELRGNLQIFKEILPESKLSSLLSLFLSFISLAFLLFQ